MSGQAARSHPKVRSAAVPSSQVPAVGDVQGGPSSSNTTDNAIAEIPHVPFDLSNKTCIDLYTVSRNVSETTVHPFVHSVELKGKKGIPLKIKGLFDDGAMVNSICKSAFALLKDKLGKLAPSQRTLRMADGTLVPSNGCWSGDVTLGGKSVRGTFEIFQSGSGWSLLFGKPLLKEFKAIHNYNDDTLMIPLNGEWTTLANECIQTPSTGIPTGDSRSVFKGDVESPSRQVLTLILNNVKQVDK